MKLFNGILGVFSIIASFFCFMYPGRTFLNMGWILTILLCLWGICALFEAFSKKSKDGAGKATAVNGILAIIGGLVAGVASVLVIVKPGISLITDMIIVFVFIFWLMVSGISSIALSVTAGRKAGGSMWIFTLIWGILTLLAGFYGLFHVFATAWALGFLFGIELMFYGVRLLSSIFES